MSLNASITSVDSFGGVVITFNNDIHILPNFTNSSYFNQSVIRFRVLVDRGFREELKPGDLNLTWECKNFTNRSIGLVITYLRPSVISPNGRQDELLVDFPKHEMLLETSTGKILREGYRMQVSLPSQKLPPSDRLKAMGESAQSSM